MLVVAFDEREDVFDKLLIFRVVANGDTKAFCRFDDAVDTDCEVLALDVDVAGIEEREQSSLTHPVEVFVVGHLRLVHQIDDAVQIFHVIASLTRGLLYAAVDIDG